ncbi:THUMP domain-containing protein 1 [Brevipalpus obovatus]|uniref:THUMP domain-containing protein 1 n=1 Tax=Brevipalpus obovatus TaxID=246614 RepID=UPI003D9DC3DF
MSYDSYKRKTHKKNYYQNYRKKSRNCELSSGLKGFILSCNNQEFHAIRTAYSLLNKYADKLYPSADQVMSPDNDADLEESLNKEIETIKKEQHRFNRVGTNCRNMLFIKCQESIDPSSIMMELLKSIEETGQENIQPVIKMMPVQATCNAYTDDIKKKLLTLIEPLEDKDFTYYIMVRIRNNDSVKKEEIVVHLVDLVTTSKKKWTADFNEAKLTISIEVVNTVCCISLLQDFNHYRKYNLEEFISWVQKKRNGDTGGNVEEKPQIPKIEPQDSQAMAEDQVEHEKVSVKQEMKSENDIKSEPMEEVSIKQEMKSENDNKSDPMEGVSVKQEIKNEPI